MRRKLNYLIQSRAVTIFDRQGNRIRTRWGRWVNWRRHPSHIDNFRDAVLFVTRQMERKHIGGIVVVRLVVNGIATPRRQKVFQAKWGVDDMPFTRFEGPAGDWLRREANKRLAQKQREEEEL